MGHPPWGRDQETAVKQAVDKQKLGGVKGSATEYPQDSVADGRTDSENGFGFADCRKTGYKLDIG